eukprot:TRINITY_DN21149_c0_g1_i1.p1 TRINITY_DN21149_c0_g1~~TRINITY_DN21149_c0_g1_i1.p1  ORF type:complete len:617 (+),score=72.07 TRINITY_DN21149_c0_g1_i1:67-1917(+)
MVNSSRSLLSSVMFSYSYCIALFLLMHGVPHTLGEFSPRLRSKIRDFDLTAEEEHSLLSLSATKIAWAPSCSPQKLSADQLRDASRIRRSTTGNAGGVFFLELQNPTCTVVVKPQNDIHDVFASALAFELGVPVVDSVAFHKDDLRYAAILESFARIGQNATLEAAVDMGSGLIKLMALAQGTDMQSATLKTVGWMTCDVCLGDLMSTKILNKFEALAEPALKDKVLEKLSTTPKLTDFVLDDLCKDMWNYTITFSPDRLDQFNAGRRPFRCPAAWRQDPVFHEDFAEICEAEQLQPLLEKRICPKEKLTKAANCPETMKPGDHVVDDIKERLSSLYKDPSVLSDYTTLSAYGSLIGENDVASIIGVRGGNGNYGNLFFSDGHVEGIDMAVGGALHHRNIKPGVAPNETKIPFRYDDVFTASTITVCGSYGEVNALAEEGFVNKMVRPWGGMLEDSLYQSCANTHGRVVPLQEAYAASAHILRSWPYRMQELLSEADTAIQTTAARLKHLDEPGVSAIEEWLLFHAWRLKESVRNGISVCPEPPEPRNDEIPLLPTVVLFGVFLAAVAMYLNRSDTPEVARTVARETIRRSTRYYSTREIPEDEQGMELAMYPVRG